MRRHLTQHEAEFAIRRGAGIAQLLGAGPEIDEQQTVRWIGVHGTDPYTLRIIHAFDDRNPAFTDIVEFSDVHEDAWPEEHSFADARSLIEWASAPLVAAADRWVNARVIDAECARWLEEQGAHDRYPSGTAASSTAATNSYRAAPESFRHKYFRTSLLPLSDS